MIRYHMEEEMSSNSASNFEGYMFATVGRHIERHTKRGLDLMKIGIFGPDRDAYFNEMPDQKQRKKLLTQFNKKMKDHGIDPMKEAKKLKMGFMYVDDLSDVKKLMDVLYSFCMEKNRVAAAVFHCEQKYPDSNKYSLPHIHYIYDEKEK